MSDAELTAAAEEAIAEEVIDPEVAEDEVAEEIVEELVEDVIDEEKVDELLPTDHKERSDLGRKVAALLRKTDKTDEVLLKVSEALERIISKDEVEEEDVYVTKKELKEFISQPAKEASQYEKDFKETFWVLSEKNNLSDEEAEEVGKILLEKHNARVMDDGRLDGAINFERALTDYRQSKKKVLPTKGNKAPGVLKKQVADTKVAQKKPLDRVTESLLKFIERTDGAEKADKMRKSI